MPTVVMADDGIAFDGATAEAGPLGGAETAFVALAEALAARGHQVEVRNRCVAPLTHKGVHWAPLDSGVPAECDLYIGNRGHRVIELAPGARRRLFWIHNPAQYLRKPRYLWPLLRYRPTVVVSGASHARTVPAWLPRRGCEIIPYGILDTFRHAEPREPPPPVALFTSNPLRGLDWLLDLWVERVAPAVPGAELHIYAGAAVYGGVGAERMRRVLDRADALQNLGVRRFAPVGREALVQVLRSARAMLYRGDPGETFCLAVAEAQAMGVPAVVRPLGSLGERVTDGISGRIAHSDDAFAEAAIAVLRDDEIWRRWHLGALETRRGLSWDEVAARFERLM
jgi:glycosyltransferase involved in cell wall biosynthesis